MQVDKFYNTFGQVYQENQYLKVDPRTNSVIVINRGDMLLRVNGVPLAPSPLGPGFAGESIAFSGNSGEYFRGMLEIVFDPLSTDPQACVVQKFYID